MMMMMMMMMRSPLRKLHHYELRATHSHWYSAKHCGRGAGTIESRGCNTFHGGINARGALWIHPGRDRETRYSMLSAILAISEVDCVTSRPTIHRALGGLPNPQSCDPSPLWRMRRVRKINGSLRQLRGSLIRENAGGLIRRRRRIVGRYRSTLSNAVLCSCY